jgi:DNA invertase Pin-like site-specific DNA recombinase
MEKLAYSYIRFSRAIQGQDNKDSLRRQLQGTREFCRKHGFKLVEEMQDLGVSGFTGKNLEETAKLGAFLKKVEEGLIPAGSCLVVESFDRLSRTKILRCQKMLTDLLCAGIQIAPLSFNEILSEETVNKNPSLLILAIVEQMRGGNESMHKSNRIHENFNQKREAIKRGEKVYFGGCMPGWITGIKGGEWTLHKERVATVKRIYSSYIDGESLCGIAKQLNTEKVCPMKRNHECTWRQNSVKKVLINESVTGTFEMKGISPIKNYLPVIVPESDFLAVQTKLKQGKNRKSRGENVRNLFQGLTACTHCLKAKRTGTCVSTHGNVVRGKRYDYYYCVNASQDNCEAKGHIRADLVERVLFETILQKAPSEYLTKEDKEIQFKIEALQGRDESLEKEINNFLSMMKAGVQLKQVTDGLLKAQNEKAEIEKQIKDLSAQTSTLSELPKAVEEFSQLVKQDLKDNDVRKKLVNVLPRIVKKVEFDLVKQEFGMLLESGGWFRINANLAKGYGLH